MNLIPCINKAYDDNPLMPVLVATGKEYVYCDFKFDFHFVCSSQKLSDSFGISRLSSYSLFMLNSKFQSRL